MGPIAKARAKWRASLPKSKPAPMGPRKVVGGGGDAPAVRRKRKRTVLFDDSGEEDNGSMGVPATAPSSLPPSSSSRSSSPDIVKDALNVARAARARKQDKEMKERKEQQDLLYVIQDTNRIKARADLRIKERAKLELIKRIEVHWPEDNDRAMRDFELITGRPLPLRLFS